HAALLEPGALRGVAEQMAGNGPVGGADLARTVMPLQPLLHARPLVVARRLQRLPACRALALLGQPIFAAVEARHRLLVATDVQRARCGRMIAGTWLLHPVGLGEHLLPVLPGQLVNGAALALRIEILLVIERQRLHP